MIITEKDRIKRKTRVKMRKNEWINFFSIGIARLAVFLSQSLFLIEKLLFNSLSRSHFAHQKLFRHKYRIKRTERVSDWKRLWVRNEKMKRRKVMKHVTLNSRCEWNEILQFQMHTYAKFLKMKEEKMLKLFSTGGPICLATTRNWLTWSTCIFEG
jgi:hypothetical protein